MTRREEVCLPPKYDIERVLGRGGMGTVFQARHSRLGQRVAIKVLGDELRAHPELVTRFEREAHAAASLSSPHAAKIFDIDRTANGTPFMVMELLDGNDLAHVLDHAGPPAISSAVRWIIEACDAIGEAHRLGIVHRDIKPSNLFLCRDRSIKVLDFGIAKRVAAGDASITLGIAPLGTPQYMSPEQARCAKDIDARTDIWSLGVSLYELLCGRPPFNHKIPQACVVAIVTDPIPDPRAFRTDLPDALATAILRALAKEPKDRYQSVDELVLAIAPFAEPARFNDDSLRAVSTARRSVARELTTVDGDPTLEPSCEPPRKPQHQASSEPPPPVWLGLGKDLNTRVRRSTTLAVAAVALVVAGAAFAPSRSHTTSVTSAMRRSETVTTPTDHVDLVDESALEPAGPPAPVTPLVRVTDPPPAPAPSAVAPAPQTAPSPSMSLVHGGISGPGF